MADEEGEAAKPGAAHAEPAAASSIPQNAKERRRAAAAAGKGAAAQAAGDGWTWSNPDEETAAVRKVEQREKARLARLKKEEVRGPDLYPGPLALIPGPYTFASPAHRRVKARWHC